MGQTKISYMHISKLLEDVVYVENRQFNLDRHKNYVRLFDN